jgi:hypothetical protein
MDQRRTQTFAIKVGCRFWTDVDMLGAGNIEGSGNHS